METGIIAGVIENIMTISATEARWFIGCVIVIFVFYVILPAAIIAKVENE